MFVSITYILIPVNIINKMHLVKRKRHYERLPSEYKHPGNNQATLCVNNYY